MIPGLLPDGWSGPFGRCRRRAAATALVDGVLTGAERAGVLAHVAVCPDCAAEAAAHRRLKTRLAGAGDPLPRPGFVSALVASVPGAVGPAVAAAASPRRRCVAPLGGRPLPTVAALAVVAVSMGGAAAVTGPTAAVGTGGSGPALGGAGTVAGGTPGSSARGSVVNRSTTARPGAGSAPGSAVPVPAWDRIGGPLAGPVVPAAASGPAGVNPAVRGTLSVADPGATGTRSATTSTTASTRWITGPPATAGPGRSTR